MTTFSTSRDIPAPLEKVFAALQDPERLARWWGPAGFTNTFQVCELHTGGRWSFIMQGPDGRQYPNESRFEEVTAPTRLVVQHVNAPHFRLTISLSPVSSGTRVGWQQVFEDEQVAASVRAIVEPANEQNLDRLTAEVLHSGVSA